MTDLDQQLRDTLGRPATVTYGVDLAGPVVAGIAGRRRRRRVTGGSVAGLAVAAVAVVAIAGAGGADRTVDPGPAATTSPTATTAPVEQPGSFQIRKVRDVTYPEHCADPGVEPAPDQTMRSCDDGTFYTLEPAVVVGGIADTDYGIPQGSVQWQVGVQLDARAAERFRELSQELVGTGRQFAIVYDGRILSAPTFEGVVPDGRLQITGDYTESEARDLAAALVPTATPSETSAPPSRPRLVELQSDGSLRLAPGFELVRRIDDPPGFPGEGPRVGVELVEDGTTFYAYDDPEVPDGEVPAASQPIDDDDPLTLEQWLVDLHDGALEDRSAPPVAAD